MIATTGTKMDTQANRRTKMTKEQQIDDLVDRMIIKFKEMKGQSLSDGEIARVFDGCVSRSKLIEKFTMMRDTGMKMSHVKSYRPGCCQLNRFNAYSDSFIGTHSYIGAPKAKPATTQGKQLELL